MVQLLLLSIKSIYLAITIIHHQVKYGNSIIQKNKEVLSGAGAMEKIKSDSQSGILYLIMFTPNTHTKDKKKVEPQQKQQKKKPVLLED